MIHQINKLKFRLAGLGRQVLEDRVRKTGFRKTGLGRISPYAVGPALILDFITSTQIKSCLELNTHVGIIIPINNIIKIVKPL